MASSCPGSRGLRVARRWRAWRFHLGRAGHNLGTIASHCPLGSEEVRRREDVAGAVRAARDSQAEALNVFSSPVLSSLHREIIAFAAEYRLPAIYQWKEHAEAGGLVSYGPNLAAIWRQSAIIVAKLLKGVKPADLPVEQPTKFELVVNLKTAGTLGMTIPPTLLLRADEVIE
jgi:putative ABC transport system substrate-binding protein